MVSRHAGLVPQRWPLASNVAVQTVCGGMQDDWTQGSFRGERVGTPFPLLKSCRNAWERRSPLLKCLRTHKTHLKLRRRKIKAVLDSYLMPNQES